MSSKPVRTCGCVVCAEASVTATVTVAEQQLTRHGHIPVLSVWLFRLDSICAMDFFLVVGEGMDMLMIWCSAEMSMA